MWTIVDITVFQMCIVDMTEVNFFAGKIGETTLSGRSIIRYKVYLYGFCCLASNVVIVSRKCVPPVLVVLGCL
jgi:hypothetical protein